ncbi:reverse transcriptase domain-containing protein [Tanacetum coccineum]
MADEDEEKTAFHTCHGVYCYTKMPFGLKNARATYQRLVDKAFKKQIRRNLEVYVDNLMIKSHTKHEILRDVKETFRTLRKINMKLNLKKCTFGVEEGMFLGHIVNMEGIKSCPEKAKAVIKLSSPRTLKEVQILNGKLARAKKAFQEMKRCIAELSTLTAPKPKEDLIMYLYAAREAVSAFLLTKRESQQRPIYFGSRALQAPETSHHVWKGQEHDLIEFTYALRFKFKASNNEAEYEALVGGLCIAEQMGVQNLEAKVPRSENKKTDALSKIVSTSFAHLTKQVLVEVLKEKSIEEKEIMVVVEEEGYIDYFLANTSPDSSNDLTKYLLATLVLSPLHDDPYMEIMQVYDAIDNELPIPPLQAPIAPPTVMSPSPVLSLSPMFDSRDLFPPEEISPPKDIETFVESPIPISQSSSVGSSSPVRSTTPPPDYPFDKYIFAELDNSLWIIPRPLGSGPIPEEPNECLPKEHQTSAAPSMTQAAIRQLVVDSIAAALEAQAATMANTNNSNRNTRPRENSCRKKGKL